MEIKYTSNGGLLFRKESTKQGIFPDFQTLLSVHRILLGYNILGLIGYHFSIKYNSKYKIHDV